MLLRAVIVLGPQLLVDCADAKARKMKHGRNESEMRTLKGENMMEDVKIGQRKRSRNDQ